MFRVETYINPHRFYNEFEVNEEELHIINIPILAMHTKDLVSANKDTAKYRWNIHIYHTFYKMIYPITNNVKYSIDIKQVLRRVIRKQTLGKDECRYLLNHVNQLYEIYCYWIKLGIDYIDPLVENHSYEQVKIRLFNEFTKEQLVQKCIQEQQSDYTMQEISNKLEMGVNNTKNRVDKNYYAAVKRIYIYDISYLEPVRYQFFQKLSKAGYEVIFRIPYDSRYPKVYRQWKEIYNKVVPFEEWEIKEEGNIQSNILEFLEGRKSIDQYKKQITVHTYTEPTLFKKYLAEHPLDKHLLEVVGCEEESLNEYFRDELDSDKEIEHLFETPLGRFIHQIYNVVPQGQDYEMSYEIYQQLMTSGVINMHQTKGRTLDGADGVSLLSDLREYMEGVTSLGQIKDRLQKLKELQDISSEFEDLSRSKVDGHQVKRYLQNPFRVFSFVNLQSYELTINQLIVLTEQLESLLYEYLIKYSPVEDSKVHIEYLLEDLKQSNAYTQCSSDFERVYEKFIEKFAKLKIETYEIHEMLDYVSVIGKVPSKKHEKGELILIKGIDHILGFCANSVQEVFICDLSTTAMNNHIQKKLKRVEMRTIETLRKYADKMVHMQLIDVLDIAISVREHVQSFVKFNMMLLLTYYPGKIHLGWIKNMHEYDTEWYLLNIIKQLYDVEQALKESDELQIFNCVHAEKESVEVSEKAIEYISKEMAPFAWDDLEQCPNRFYYSNVVNPHPIYKSDFTQRIAFGWLGKMMEDQYNGKEQVLQQLFPLFPQWANALKSNLIDTTNACKIDQYITFDNIKFPTQMSRLWALGRQGTKPLNSKEKQKKLQDLLNGEDTIKGIPSKKCYFCPHQLICQEGAFAVDNEY